MQGCTRLSASLPDGQRHRCKRPLLAVKREAFSFHRFTRAEARWQVMKAALTSALAMGDPPRAGGRAWAMPSSLHCISPVAPPHITGISSSGSAGGCSVCKEGDKIDDPLAEKAQMPGEPQPPCWQRGRPRDRARVRWSSRQIATPQRSRKNERLKNKT